jgi:hypothetical protein
MPGLVNSVLFMSGQIHSQLEQGPVLAPKTGSLVLEFGGCFFSV